MSNPTTSLEFSCKVFEIIGEQETENRGMSDIKEYCKSTYIPYYTFGELLRVIPLIAEKKKLPVHPTDPTIAYKNKIIKEIACLYSDAPTPEEGMQAVESYLEQYL